MDARIRNEARRLREAIRAGRASPARVRAALADIPPASRDAWFDAVWDLEGTIDDEPGLPRGCVPYLPCAVATLVEALEVLDVGPDDVFVDVGAGPGRALAFAHLFTGATGVGLEIQPTLNAAALVRARALGLETRLRFVEGDAAGLVEEEPSATVWFLYCPFDHRRLERFLAGVESLAQDRQRRLLCVDMPPIERAWLEPVPTRGPELCAYRVAKP